MSTSKFFSKTFLALIAMALSGCELSPERKPEETKDTNLVLPYFTYTQFGITNWPQLKEIFANFHGITYVTEPGSSWGAISKPPVGECMYSADLNSRIPIKPLRYLNIGDVTIRGEKMQDVSVPAAPYPTFAFSKDEIPLDFGGTYSMQTSGVKDRMKWSQPFSVPTPASGMKIRRADNVEFNLPSPVMRAADPDPAGGRPWPVPAEDVVTIDKTKDFFLTYALPKEATYARVTITDGGTGEYGSITCYGDKTGSIWVPADLLTYFLTTDQGLMYIDFISLNVRKDVNGVSESVMEGITRQLHGRKNFLIPGKNQEVYFGVLKFE